MSVACMPDDYDDWLDPPPEPDKPAPDFHDSDRCGGCSEWMDDVVWLEEMGYFCPACLLKDHGLLICTNCLKLVDKNDAHFDAGAVCPKCWQAAEDAFGSAEHAEHAAA